MFKFSLQRVLDLRAKKEQEAAATLASARDEADAARQEHDELEQARSHGVTRIAEVRGGGGMTVGQLQNLGLVIQSLDRQLASARDQVQQADAQVERRMADFTLASQDRRVLDRLREKHLQVWQTDAMQQDRKAMDSIALTRHARTQASKNETPA